MSDTLISVMFVDMLMRSGWLQLGEFKVLSPDEYVEVTAMAPGDILRVIRQGREPMFYEIDKDQSGLQLHPRGEPHD